jgi:hypothetical protein
VEKSKSQAVKEDFWLKLQNYLLVEKVRGEERNPFDVRNGAKGGCIFSLFLFECCLDCRKNI